MLQGWFQNLEEFANVEDEVRKQFTFAQPFKGKIKHLRDNIIDNSKHSVSIHVRRGDFINNPTAYAHNEHMGPEYYRKAMDIMEDIYDDNYIFCFL